jgi:hypothetical protein
MDARATAHASAADMRGTKSATTVPASAMATTVPASAMATTTTTTTLRRHAGFSSEN